MCELFFFGRSQCKIEIDRSGTLGHFFEATTVMCAMFLCTYLLIVLCRSVFCYNIQLQYPLTDEERKRSRKHTRNLRLFTALQLSMAVFVILVSIYLSGHERFDFTNHPFIIIHTVIYRLALCWPFVAYPILQLLFSSNVHLSPLKCYTSIALSFTWMVDIYLQLDYRVLDTLGLGWTIITGAEIVTLLLQYAISAEYAILLDIGQNRLPQFDFSEYVTEENEYVNGGSENVNCGTTHVLPPSNLEFNDSVIEEEEPTDP